MGGGCEETSRPSAKKDARAQQARDVAPPVAVDAAIDAAPPRKVFVTGAGRCGECHEKMYDEWEVSGHAAAASSSLYKAAVASAQDTTCARCHAPLAGVTTDNLASEGVTCDVCHTLREPTPSVSGAGFTLAIDDMVKFGPRCDLPDHYFHRMGCSPVHAKAELCGACHWWEPKGLPVFTEFTDWRDGPAAKAGQACQGCHMPKEKAPLAVGSPARTGVPHHGLLGLALDLRTRALAVEVAARDDKGALVVAITLTNVNAGHHVPAGLPERRVLVRARVLDAQGATVATEERWLGRSLVDATGAEVPFWRATKVGADTRIAPHATWTDELRFSPPSAGRLEVDVLYRGLSPAIATQLGITDVEESVFARTQLAFGAAGATGRAKLPKTVTVRPAAAGKRPRKVAP